tara:strand:+ start:1526 stop:2074 length:549 start_codon:yes stop_codon:yes gene_type:complete
MDYTQYNQEMTSISRNLIEKAKRIKLLILDVDGVMTDGGIIVSEDGTESKRFYAQDGHGLVILKSLDIELGIISGRSSKAVEHRANELGFNLIIQNSRNKLEDFHNSFSKKYTYDQVCFVGDDIVDIELIKKVGLSVTVPNSNYNGLTKSSDWITPRQGGFGAVRDVCDLIILANNDKKSNK